MKCPCGSDIMFETCCSPLLEGTKQAPTALALMRSRYTAYVRADIEYLEKTLAPGELDSFDSESTRSWAEQSDWLGLEIVSVEKGEEKDKEGVVEFIARYRQEGHEEAHHERSLFFKSKGSWYFVGGCYIEPESSEKTTPRIGRSMDCPCGSGKKYKKCCG